MLARLVVMTVLAADGGVSASDAGVRTDGGTQTFISELYGSCPDAPPSMPLDGGWVLLPPARAQRLACLMETCDVARQGEKKIAEEPPYWWAIGMGLFGAGLAAGMAVSFFVPK